MASGGGRHKWRGVVLVALAIAVVAGIYTGGLALYFAAQHRASAVSVKNDNVPRDHLEALARTVSVDPNKGDLVVRVEVRPDGGLAGPDGITVTEPVSLDVVGGTGTASYRYKAGDRISPVDVTIGLNGDVNSYPFDSYKSALIVDATATSTTQPGAEPTDLPTRLVFDGTLSGYRVNASPVRTDSSAVNVLALDLTLKRASVTTAFAILLLVLQGMLAIAAALLAAFIIRGHRRVEIPMLTWLAALLFATIPLRNAMPSAPPIGAEIDVLVFFWVVTV
ncbi:MAG TPA: DUF4436 family protein, partial [Acidimicrobiales bacterium]